MKVLLAMSGGVDSALTAAVFKKAGFHVIGVTMPIHQEPVETQRGIETCEALGVEHQHVDLSALYDQTLAAQAAVDDGLLTQGEGATFVDVYAVLAADVNRYIGEDGLHPTEAGYDRMALKFYEAIRRELEEK